MSGLAVTHSINHIKKTLGLTQEALASSIGASSRSIRRWEKQDVTIKSDTVEKLQMLDDAIHTASGIMKQNEVETWFQTVNPALGNVKPIELIDSYKGLTKIQRTLSELEWGLF